MTFYCYILSIATLFPPRPLRCLWILHSQKHIYIYIYIYIHRYSPSLWRIVVNYCTLHNECRISLFFLFISFSFGEGVGYLSRPGTNFKMYNYKPFRLFFWAGVVGAVRRIFAVRPQSPQFDPRLCRDFNICATFFPF